MAGAQIPIGPPPPPPSAPVVPTPAAPLAKHIPGPPGVAAVVNGEKISLPQVQQLAMQLHGADTLELLINNTLVDQEAKKENITVTPAEINARLVQIKQQIAQQPGNNLDTLLAQSHMTMANFKDSLRLRLEADKLMSKKLPPIVAVHARHILVLTTVPPGSPNVKPHSDEDARKLIAKAQEDLKNGKSWDEVCKKYSEDPSNKDKGGDLGIIATGQPYDPTFLNAALSLKKGQVTPEPVKSMYGYHLIKVDSTSVNPTPEDKQPLAAAVNAARQQMLQNSLQAYLEKLRQSAKVVSYLTP